MPEGDNELAILRLAWRVDALEKWRKEATDDLDALGSELENVVNEQRIAFGVARELEKRGVSTNPLGLSWYQKLGGLIMGGLVVADAVRGLFS